MKDSFNKNIFIVFPRVFLLALLLICLYSFRNVSRINATDSSLPPTLSSLAKAQNVNIGSLFSECFTANAPFSDKCKNSVVTEYGGMTLTIENDWKQIEPTQGNRTYGFIDAMMRFATANNLKIHQVHLFGIGYGTYIPAWIFPSGFNGTCDHRTPEELDALIKNQIEGTIQHEASTNTVVMWNVTNEAFDNNGKLHENCFKRLLGDNYLDRAFQYAREAAPHGILVFNEHFPIGNNAKVDGFFSYIDAAKKRGIPIDVAGIQNHLTATNGAQFTPAYMDFFNSILTKAKAIGIKVAITEMDVYQATKTQDDVKQVYKETLAACLQDPDCISFETWGLSDGRSWLHTNPLLANAQPLLYDENYDKKPAFDGMVEALQEAGVCKADVNGDKIVDGKDYVSWLKNYSLPTLTTPRSDMNHDGKVDGIDYTLWLQSYRKSCLQK